MNRKTQRIVFAGMLLFSTHSYALFDGWFSDEKPKEGGATKTDFQSIEKDADLFIEGKNKQLAPFFRNLWLEGERNAVLNFNYLGLAAMEVGDYQVAKSAFDESLLRIEAIYANDKNAEKAKSLWNEEKVKDFKGEPYERSMAYYYRGLLYLKDGDYQNARAAFLSAERHDTLSEQEQFQGDFGLMNYLAAWSSYCDKDNGRAKELYNRATTQDAEHFKSVTLENPFIVLAESGLSPEKTGTGKFKEVLEIKPPSGKEPIKKIGFPRSRVYLVSDTPVLVGDLSYQATTRGGRPIQGILNGKAQFKGNVDTASNVAIGVGAATLQASAYSGDNDTAAAGAIISAVGLIGKLVSSAVTPKADTRMWSSLPDHVYLVQSATIPSMSGLDVEVAMNEGKAKPVAAKMVHQSSGCGFAWVRANSALVSPQNGTARINSTPEIEETNRVERNRAFRNMLVERFSSANTSKN